MACDHHDERNPDRAMNAPPALRGQAGQIPARQQGLNEDERHRGHSRQTGRDVNRLAPRQQRTCRGDDDGNGDGHHKCGPNQDRLDWNTAASHTCQAG